MKTFVAVLLFFLAASKCINADICDIFRNSNTYPISEKCQSQLDIACKYPQLLWRMFDASSKYPISGMSFTNNRDFGNFDECIDTNFQSLEGDVIGKYCGLGVAVVNMFINPLPDPYIIHVNTKPRNLVGLPRINSLDQVPHNLTKTALKDDPPVSISSLSMCIPDACTPKEVGEFFIWGKLSDLNQSSLVYFPGVVPCLTKDSNTDFKWGDILFTAFLALILCLMVFSTAYDFLLLKLGKKTKHPLALAFSVITNGQKLIAISNNPGQIQCLNGLRFISMMWVIAGHNYVAFEQVPLVNYAKVSQFIDRVAVQYLTSGPIAVDTFFFLSGFLLTYGYLKSYTKTAPLKQVMGVPMLILHRYLRLTPAVAVAYFGVITIFRMIGTGPLWDSMATGVRKQCETHWWPFFLYVQNYVNDQDMCLNHTWYLSADMQMFLLAPFVLIPLTMMLKKDKTNMALTFLGILTAICIGFPMLIRFLDHNITNVYDTHSRLNDYLIGVILGVILRQYKPKRYPFSKIVNLIIWCIVIVTCIAFNLYYHNVIRIYEHTKDTLFYGLYRPIWCASLAWIVYSCHHGYGGPVNWILSLPALQIGARLSYCMYILHAIVQMYWVGVDRTPFFWGDYQGFYVWCGHFIVTMILSAVWSLAFESPMIVIEKFIFGGGNRRTPARQQQPNRP